MSSVFAHIFLMLMEHNKKYVKLKNQSKTDASKKEDDGYDFG